MFGAPSGRAALGLASLPGPNSEQNRLQTICKEFVLMAMTGRPARIVPTGTGLTDGDAPEITALAAIGVQ